MQRELTYAQAVLEASENTAIKCQEYSHFLCFTRGHCRANTSKEEEV